MKKNTEKSDIPSTYDMYLPNQDKTIKINAMVADGGIQFLPVYNDKIIGFLKKAKRKRG